MEPPEGVVADLVAAGEHLPAVPALALTPTVEREVRAGARSDDPWNAVRRWISVRGDRTGALSGLRVSLKDSVAIGGVPLTCGSAALPDFIPSGDASVVRELLDAGAELVAVTTMDDLAFSGGGDSCVDGPVLNPHDPTRSAGGSSSGAAASLHLDGVDVAIGTDQGGSSRVPASWCGVLGLKPTRGLVPYTGVVPGEPSLDHIGLLARTTGVLRRVLGVVAIDDGTDLRQRGVPRLSESTSAGPLGARAVVLRALVDRSAPEVAAAFRRDCDAVRALGVNVVETDLDPDAFGPVAAGLFVEGLAATLAGTASGFGHRHVEWRELTRALEDGVRRHEERLSLAVRVTLAAARTLARTRPGEAYSRAAAQAGALTAAFTALLAEFDFVLTPTTPFPPFPVMAAGPEDQVRRGWAVLGNTGFANVTGQPALSVPLSLADGMPSGLQIVGAHGTDLRLLDLAAALLQEAPRD
ncbi:amidase family protein [Nocardioides sp. L-11A]|uniref:amidase family protein n=1 Tax=Nocardioides sp. L-11A TaxID=3043848 RepID=UPI00249A9872|nr:amidase family protein [Nocardioides sp. L-11A]